MYETYQIDLPSSNSLLLNAKTARSVIGAALKDVPIPEKDRLLLFARNESNQTLQRNYQMDGCRYAAPAPVIIGGGDRRVVITALGPEGAALVKQHLVTIANALSIYVSSPWSLRPYTGECSVQPYGTRMYWCSTMVVEKNKRNFRAILERCPKDARGNPAPTMEVLNAQIKRAIVHGLVGQSLMLDELCATNLFAQLPSDERLNVNIVSGNPFMMRLHVGKGAHAIAIKNLIFSMDAELKGPWFAGQLRARMCGSIKPLLPHDLERIQAAEAKYQAAHAAKEE